MKRLSRCCNPKYQGSTGSEDDDTAFTLTVETFSFEELSAATNNFDWTQEIGSGGQGVVYKGDLPGIGQVAVKWLKYGNFASIQKGFLREVYVLNSTNYPHIVKLLGCCSEGKNRLLVYEYAYGTLRGLLSALDWYTRMKIAHGAAMVLKTLHLEFDPPIIHRDFKSDNILLRRDFEPMVSDFGTAKIAPAGDELIAVASAWVGTPGYMAPEIAMQANPTVMIDIYSFGVVLLELITGKTAIDSSKEGEERNLVHWARCKLNDGKFEELLDPRLQGTVSKMVLTKALAIADKCTMKEEFDRPEIKKVVKDLDHVVSISLSRDDDTGASSSAEVNTCMTLSLSSTSR